MDVRSAERTVFSRKGLGYVLVQLAAKAFGLANIFAIATVSDSADTLGRYAGSALLAAAVTLIADGGSSAATLRSSAFAQGYSRLAGPTRSRLTLLTCLVVPLVLASFGGSSAVSTPLSALALGLIMSINAIIEAYFLGAERFFLASIPNLLFNSCITGLLVCLLLEDYGLGVVGLLRVTMAGASVASVAGALALCFAVRRSDETVLYETKVAARAATASVAMFLATQADLAVLAIWSTSAALGTYSFAMRVAGAAASVPQLFVASRQSALARVLTEGSAYRAMRKLQVQLVAITASLSLIISLAFLVLPAALPSDLDGIGELMPLMLSFLPSFGFQALALAACRTAAGNRISIATTAIWLTAVGALVAGSSLLGVQTIGLPLMVFLRLIVDVTCYSALSVRVLGRLRMTELLLVPSVAIGVYLSGLSALLFPSFTVSAVSNFGLALLCIWLWARERTPPSDLA